MSTNQTIDMNTFFREATLRICGSLNIEEWLHESFCYLSRFIPADTAYLTKFYPEQGTQKCLARAAISGVETLDVEVPVPDSVRKHLGRGGTTRIARCAEELIQSRAWIQRGLLDGNVAILSSRLTVSGQIIGAVIFTNPKSGSFTEQHAKMIATLCEPFAVALSNTVRFRELTQIKELLAEDNRFLRAELKQGGGEKIIGEEQGLKQVMRMVRRVAPLNSPVLLLGETGAGKEVIANAIHSLSPRNRGPFVKVNCGAIPESLLDSELFGHEKGAFTGAQTQKRGRFERGQGGTVFLDEIAELKPDAQVRLLRVLQEKELERVGGTETIKLDIRVIAATHRNLEKMVKTGAFREDLYFRIKVFPISIPPLRDRKEDIPLLAEHFLRKKTGEMGLRTIPALLPEAVDSLMKYDWPGNARELENAVERALIAHRGKSLSFALGPLSSLPPPVAASSREESEPDRNLALDAVISEHILRVLELTGGKVSGKKGAACLLELNPSTLRKKMRKLNIPFGRKAQRE